MPPGVGLTLLKGGLDLVNNVFGNWQNAKSVEATNQANIESQERINQQNLQQQWQMWEATNAYNHPAAQMARYKEAGLNPNLMYGQSNTAQQATVGNAQAARLEAPKYQNMLDNADISSLYMSLMKQREEVEAAKLDNDIKRSALDDLKKQPGLQNQLVSQQIADLQKTIDLKGLDYTYKQLDNQLKQFEVDQIPTLRKLAENRLSLSNSQVDLIPLIRAKEEAQLKLTEMQTKLGYSMYLLNSAQTHHELAKIGVTLQEKENLLKQYEKMAKEIEKISSDISMNEFNKQLKTYETNRPFQSGGIFQSALGSIYDMSKEWSSSISKPFKFLQ